MLAGIWTYIIGGLAIFAVSGIGVGWTVHQVDLASYNQLVADQKQAVIDAQKIGELNQKVQDTINQQAAITEAKAQQALEDKTNGTVQHIPIYVKNNVGCNTWGLIRVLDAAATSRDPSELDPTGKPDASCSTFSNTELAASVARNYGLANQNAEQLNALESVVTALHDASVKAASDAENKSWWQRNVGWP